MRSVSDRVMIRATNTKQGFLKKTKITIVALAMVALNTYARHDTVNAAGAADPNDGVPATVIDGAARDLARGLIGHWTFDEGKGMIARDSSGRNNHGTIMGSAKWAKGRIGRALDFDGTDDFVSIPNEGNFDITGSITVTAWIRVNSFTRSWQAIVTKGDRAWRLHRANDTNSLGWACSDLSRQEVGDLYGKKAVN
ncbi:MAG: LamG-like jellyroll fold domain-containing protein, partial [Planctomycetota bacterium]